jgi:hypothetical protein
MYVDLYYYSCFIRIMIYLKYCLSLRNTPINQSILFCRFEKLSSSIEKVLNLIATSTAESVVKVRVLLVI